MDEVINIAGWLENIGEIEKSNNGEFFWMIPEIFIYSYKNCVTSPCFSFDQGTWHLVIMPTDGHNCIDYSGDYIGLFLWPKTRNPLELVYDVQLGVRALNDLIRYFHEGKTSSVYGFGIYDFLCTKDVANDAFLHGRMKIFCILQRQNDIPKDLVSGSTSEIDECKNGIDVDNEKEENESEFTSTDALIESLRNLLHDEKSCDVVLKTNSSEFRAHRLILGARSPVFASMFQHDMNEKKTGEVDISDCSAAEFKVFLQFLYTGSVNMCSVNVLDLYYIADKYQIDDLKTGCVEYLRDSISVVNFCDVMSLSLKHSESDLKSAAIQFFCKNIKKIVETVEWQSFITQNPIHANELIIKALHS